jgi:hypothetical protein
MITHAWGRSNQASSMQTQCPDTYKVIMFVVCLYTISKQLRSFASAWCALNIKLNNPAVLLGSVTQGHSLLTACSA